MDAIDEKILSLLSEDARRTYDDIGRKVSLSAPAVKRRIDNLRATGALLGFTTVVNHEARGLNIEAFVHLYYAAGALRDEVVDSLRAHPEVEEAWMVTGEADVLAHVRTRDAESLEALILEFKRMGLVDRTRSEIVLSQLIRHQTAPTGGDAEDMEQLLR
jgi:DNA-binding Lrp family transcriptional regulator